MKGADRLGNAKKDKKAYCLWLERSWIPLMEARAREEGVPEPRVGRVGGVVEWIRRLIARELDLPSRLDPHEQQQTEQTGRPNPNHPVHSGRLFGRAAAKRKKSAGPDSPGNDES